MLETVSGQHTLSGGIKFSRQIITFSMINGSPSRAKCLSCCVAYELIPLIVPTQLDILNRFRLAAKQNPSGIVNSWSQIMCDGYRKSNSFFPDDFMPARELCRCRGEHKTTRKKKSIIDQHNKALENNYCQKSIMESQLHTAHRQNNEKLLKFDFAPMNNREDLIFLCAPSSRLSSRRPHRMTPAFSNILIDVIRPMSERVWEARMSALKRWHDWWYNVLKWAPHS